MKNVGIIGISEGNGHPFSFSAIINGYDRHEMSRSGWPVIADYLAKRKDTEFGVPPLRVTHCWTPDPDVSQSLSRACKIETIVDDFRQMTDKVDAVIIARDDWHSHWDLAEPFLSAGLPVFVDKPLCGDMVTLRKFLPYCDSGLLFTGSGLRYAQELIALRPSLASYGDLKLIHGTVVNDWQRYGVHLIDGLLAAVDLQPIRVFPNPSKHESVSVELASGATLVLDALGESTAVFQFDFFGTKKFSSHLVTDNFTMFRTMLRQFATMIETREPARSRLEIETSLKLLIAGQQALQSGSPVDIKNV